MDSIIESRHYVGELEESRKNESSLRDSARNINSNRANNDHQGLKSVATEPKFFFICGRCDMLVGEEDQCCQFCGAEFVPEPSDEPETIPSASAHETKQLFEGRPRGEPARPLSEIAMELIRREKEEQLSKTVDVIGMFDKGRAKFEPGHLSGAGSAAFSNSLRLLRKTEAVIRSAEEFGVDTEDARKHLISAWKACNEGRYERAIQLSERCKKKISPAVVHLVRGQISCFREAMVELKRRGTSISPLVIEMKTIQNALDELRMDDAIEMTKLLISDIKNAQMALLAMGEDVVGDNEAVPEYYGQGI